ncbi:MAG: dodecin domain-containing protein, partial [Nitrosopumilaceae archaeon]|nr:dodecin domain-containing protein [Nitrosopumilaceae archaeon]NIU85796.1 dodecin domain-containing protein [Nitrosopumilaceae archaeon]NIV64655.1 dodecin domain-containing protein [Nitrosopumilaceae archaeon]NIX60042.1 dodecin domain-containing protein [Nitrosopumilaceae archaeon]
MVVKIIELMGSSSTSWEEATNEAIKKASETVKNIHSVDVLGFKAMVRDN